MSESNPARSADRASSKDFFSRLRKNEGFFEMLTVLFGAIQICIGVLMARRQGELIDLVAGECLDKSKQYLIFKNRKTGVAGLREIEARPIPPIAARFVCMLESMQERLISAGVRTTYTHLFASPHRSNLTLCATSTSYNYALDRAADYFETAVDADNHRYYPRQHQLRRFFATVFFWSRAQGGMDTLRWFLGHTDIEHLYHYLTESTPGAVLRWAKVDFVVGELNNGKYAHHELGELMHTHFGTSNFSVLDKDEVHEYLEDLLEKGNVSVEPRFFDSGNGKSYEIIIAVDKGRRNDL